MITTDMLGYTACCSNVSKKYRELALCVELHCPATQSANNLV